MGKRQLHRSKLRGARSRASERGAAVFIVVMVITILTAVGVFAARTAGLNQRSAGYDRQSTQTGYVADYATLATLDEMNWGPAGAKPYYDLMSRGTESCAANQYIDAGSEAGLPCYKVFKSEIQERLQQAGSNAQLFDYDGGSLGPGPVVQSGTQLGNAQPDWVVELTDPGPAGPVAGTDQGGTGVAGKYVQITVTGVGQVRPRTSTVSGSCGSTEDQAASMAAGNRTTRAVARVPIL